MTIEDGFAIVFVLVIFTLVAFFAGRLTNEQKQKKSKLLIRIKVDKKKKKKSKKERSGLHGWQRKKLKKIKKVRKENDKAITAKWKERKVDQDWPESKPITDPYPNPEGKTIIFD